MKQRHMTGTMPNIVGIFMPFPSRGVCLMPYCGLMLYAMQFPASQLGSRMKLCLIRGSTVGGKQLKDRGHIKSRNIGLNRD
jgi:hypothetical protein